MCFSVFRSLLCTKTPELGSPATEQLGGLDTRPAVQGEQPTPGHDVGDPTQPEGPPDLKASEWKRTAWNTAKTTLLLIRESADAFPPLKSVAGGLCELISNFEQTASNKDSILSIVQRIQNLNESIVKRGILRDLNETKRQKRLESDLNNITKQLDHMLGENVAKRFVNNIEDAQTITGLVEDIRDSLMDYQISLQQDIYSMNLQHVESDHRNTLDRLSRAKHAGHHSDNRQPCMTGTRVELLQEIEEWASSSKALPIYWLNGVAGTGKTTVSQTLANRFFADDRLGASFFFSRDHADRSKIDLVFPTLAFQLAYQLPQFRAPLVNVIDHHPDVGEMSLAEQLKRLLIEPLQSLVGTPISTGPAIIIIIDALDECDDPEPESKFLSLLSEHITEIPFVKFFITSRPEYGIRSIFNKPLKHHTRTLVLQDIDSTLVDRDIWKYLSTRLSAIARRSDVNITAPWPSSNDIEILVRQCAGLFVYASTIGKFIESLLDDPRTRLQLITNMPGGSVRGMTSQIDRLYMKVLTHGFSTVDPDDHLCYFEQVRLVVACVLFVLNPLPLSTLAALLDVEPGHITRALRPLHSVLLVPDDVSQPIRRFHKSFPDFLIDPKRCEDRNFHIDPSVYHSKITIRCLNLVKKGLKKNICSIPQYAMNADIEDLSQRRKECIGDAVEYACMHWTDHLSSASTNGEDVNLILKLLKEFFGDQFLLWIEVFSITENLGVAVYSICRVQKWFQNTGISDIEFQELIYDCQGFVLQFFDIIRESASHIYHSALPFVPTSSQLRKRYQDEITKEVNVLIGVDPTWDACIRRIFPTGRTSRVTFSPNGNLIASNSGSVVEIFDAITGVRQATLEGHVEDARSVMFSPDNARLVSGSYDQTCKIWDVRTGGLIRTLEGHRDRINSVSFSLNGTRIASGSDDHDVHIWDASSGECIAILNGHSEVRSVCWSGDAAVVSGYEDNSVRLWDIPTKTCFKLDTRTNGGVTCSADGTKIASAWNRHIYVHDIQTGVIKTVDIGDDIHSSYLSLSGDQIVYGTYTHLYIRDISLDDSSPILVGQSFADYVCFSADGTSIASTDGNIVKIWQNWNNQTLYCHSASVGGVCFSANGQLAASASSDQTAKVWDTATGACLHTIHTSHDNVESVALSPDSSFIAWGYYYEVMIWNVRTSQLVHMMEGHRNMVERIQFSSDGCQAVSVSEENMIVWNMETGAITATVQSDFSSVQWIRFAEDATIVLRRGDIVERWELCPAFMSMLSPSHNSSESNGCNNPLVSNPSAAAFSTTTSSAGLNSIKPGLPPFVLIPSPEDHSTPVSPFSHLDQFHMQDGWILDQQGRRVSHVPEAMSWDFHDRKVIIGTVTGNVVIMSWSGTSIKQILLEGREC